MHFRSHLLPSASLLLRLLGAVAAAKTIKIATIVPDGSTWMVEMRKAGGEIAEKRRTGASSSSSIPVASWATTRPCCARCAPVSSRAGPSPAARSRRSTPTSSSTAFPCSSAPTTRSTTCASRWTRPSARASRKKGFVALAISDGGFAYLMSQKPIRRVGDLDGAKVWIVEGDLMSEIAFEIAGVSPGPAPHRRRLHGAPDPPDRHRGRAPHGRDRLPVAHQGRST